MRLVGIHASLRYPMTISGALEGRASWLRLVPRIVGVLFAVAFATATTAAADPVSAELIDRYLPQLRQLADEVGPDGLRMPPTGRQYADSPPPAIGQRETFYVTDDVKAKHYTVPATLIAMGRHSLWYRADVEPKLPAARVMELVQFFDDIAFPRVTATFGEFKGPHPEGDSRVSFLILDFRLVNRGHAAAYVHPLDLIATQHLKPDQRSNQRKLVYLNSSSVRQDAGYAKVTLAHEWCHLILRSHDLLEESWVSEGLAELAAVLCHGQPFMMIKLEDLKGVPDQPLVWGRPLRDTHRDYAIAWLWNHYLYNWTDGGRGNFFQQVVADRQTGLGTYLAPLQNLGLRLSDLYPAFWVATFFNDQALGARHCYDKSLAGFRLARREKNETSLPICVIEQLSMSGGKGLVIRLPPETPSDLALSIVHPFNVLQTPDPTTIGSQDITAAIILEKNPAPSRVIYRQLEYDKVHDVYRAEVRLSTGGARSIGVVLCSRKSIGIPASYYDYSDGPFGLTIGSNDQAFATARIRTTLAVLLEEKLQWYLTYSEKLAAGGAAEKEACLQALEGLHSEVLRIVTPAGTSQIALSCFVDRLAQQSATRRKILRPMVKKVRDFVAAGIAQGNADLEAILAALDRQLVGP